MHFTMLLLTVVGTRESVGWDKDNSALVSVPSAVTR